MIKYNRVARKDIDVGDDAVVEYQVYMGHLVREKFLELGIHIAFGQEHAIGPTALTDLQHCVIASHTKGKLGCSTSILDFCLSGHESTFLEVDAYMILHSEPRRLLVRFATSNRTITFPSTHTPDEGAENKTPGLQQKWRQEYVDIFAAFQVDVAGIDVNARVGSCLSRAIEDVGFIEEQNHVEHSCTKCVQGLDSYFQPPSRETLKAGYTWISSSGRKHRIDYIVVDERHGSSARVGSTIADPHSAAEMGDHQGPTLPFVSIQGWDCTSQMGRTSRQPQTPARQGKDG